VQSVQSSQYVPHIDYSSRHARTLRLSALDVERTGRITIAQVLTSKLVARGEACADDSANI
jgi:hypothetical protein